MKQNHTSTPWKLERSKEGQAPFLDVVGGKNGDPLSGMVVARWQFGPHRPEGLIVQDIVNAEFIVKAVNNHDALVAALREALDYIGCNSGGAVQEQMRAALKAVAESEAINA